MLDTPASPVLFFFFCLDSPQNQWVESEFIPNSGYDMKWAYYVG
ncbi:unnamed protein product [marine sediment metagenome]|uniref:Uncharacterized protein n=1 Tax=marine sediment metagenome TaxID=412755 RepID=X1DT90_9ZZZZ